MPNQNNEVNITLLCSVYQWKISTYIDIVFLALSVPTFILGVTAWTAIRKTRCINNYVLLSIIFINIMDTVLSNTDSECIASGINEPTFKVMFLIVSHFLYLYFKLSVNYWLLIFCYLFYSDLAKIYNNRTTRSYLKANLFGWVLPFFIEVIDALIMATFNQYKKYAVLIFIAIFTLPLVINFIIYFTVIYALVMKDSEVKSFGITKRQKWRLTLIFFLSGILLLLMPLRLLFIESLYTQVLFAILSRLPKLTACVYFLTTEANYKACQNYIDRKTKIRSQIYYISTNQNQSKRSNQV